MKFLKFASRSNFLKELYEDENLIEEEEIVPILLLPDERGEWYTLKLIGEKLVRTILTYYDFTFLKRIEGENEVFHFYKDRNNFIYLVNLKEKECDIVVDGLKSEIKVPIYQINFGYFEGTTFYKLPFDYFLLDKRLQKLNNNNLKDWIIAVEIGLCQPTYIL